MKKNNLLYFLLGLSAGMFATGVLTKEAHPIASAVFIVIGTMYFLSFLYVNEVKR